MLTIVQLWLSSWLRRLAAVVVVVSLTGLGLVGGASAEPLPPGLRLVMVEDDACIYCRRWMAEVGPFYSTSRQGRRAPLERRNTGDPSLAAFGRLTYTPTFLLVEDGREISRFVGYGGAKQFWGELDRVLEGYDSRAPAPRGAEPPPEDRPSTPPTEQETRLQPWQAPREPHLGSRTVAAA